MSYKPILFHIYNVACGIRRIFGEKKYFNAYFYFTWEGMGLGGELQVLPGAVHQLLGLGAGHVLLAPRLKYSQQVDMGRF